VLEPFSEEDQAMADEMTNETLIADYMEATGCDEDHAMWVLAMALSGAELTTADHLPKLVPMLVVGTGMPAAMVVTVLAGLHELDKCDAGRELKFFVGMATAKRAGISPKLGHALQAAIPRLIGQGRKTTARGN